MWLKSRAFHRAGSFLCLRIGAGDAFLAGSRLGNPIGVFILSSDISFESMAIVWRFCVWVLCLFIKSSRTGKTNMI